MEKIIYLIRTNADTSGDEFRQLALGEISQQLLANSHVKNLRMSVEDSDVARAAGLKQEKIAPLYQAMISLWVDTANGQAELLEILRPYTSRVEGYLVTESEVMAPPSAEGERTTGTVQVCALSQLADLSREEFLDIWRNSHGGVASDIQSTFGYRQNLVVRKLTDEAADHSAIVEEHFPAGAMDSPHIFFDAEGDDEKLHKHVQMMIESCARFIDPESVNVVHMSEYTVKA